MMLPPAMAKPGESPTPGEGPAAHPPQILIVGAHNSGKHSLLSSITHTHAKHAGQQQPPAAPLPWLISTKYYTASVEISCLTVHAPAAGGPPDSHEPCSGAGVLAEAVILLLDTSREDSFCAVQAWAEAHDLGSVDVQLVVGNKADLLLPRPAAAPAAAGVVPAGGRPAEAAGSMQHSETDGCEPLRPAWLNAAIDWCSSSCMEYIEVCCTDVHVDEQLRLDSDPQVCGGGGGSGFRV